MANKDQPEIVDPTQPQKDERGRNNDPNATPHVPAKAFTGRAVHSTPPTSSGIRSNWRDRAARGEDPFPQESKDEFDPSEVTPNDRSPEGRAAMESGVPEGEEIKSQAQSAPTTGGGGAASVASGGRGGIARGGRGGGTTGRA